MSHDIADSLIRRCLTASRTIPEFIAPPRRSYELNGSVGVAPESNPAVLKRSATERGAQAHCDGRGDEQLVRQNLEDQQESSASVCLGNGCHTLPTHGGLSPAFSASASAFDQDF